MNQHMAGELHGNQNTQWEHGSSSNLEVDLGKTFQRRVLCLALCYWVEVYARKGANPQRGNTRYQKKKFQIELF